MNSSSPSSSVWLDAAACRVEDLAAVVEAGRAQPAPALADEIALGVPLYDCTALRGRFADPSGRRALMAEWNDVFERGAGVLVLAAAWPETATVDAVSAEFFALIEAEKGAAAGGDHFAKAGANDRVWNALQKLALRSPPLFAAYYGNAWLAAVCEAWLGPAWQMTSQVNCVNPGGAAQSPHRDYHLGFCTPAQAAEYPAAVHRWTPRLTLQGAVAHVDMPLASGPTLLLPHSQKYPGGYLVADRADFAAYFAAEHAQLPLRKGDAVFFNPALMHAAGSNRSADVRRIANLLQVSSPFGRAMESVDRVAMSIALYPALLAAIAGGGLDLERAGHAISCCGEGYAFPTNLDTDPPLGGLAPQSGQALMRQALAESWPSDRFAAALHERTGRRRP
jgi:ectoine hydroxylase-related dioxygenase (phytanoyl-CoA dioxygenase family)